MLEVLSKKFERVMAELWDLKQNDDAFQGTEESERQIKFLRAQIDDRIKFVISEMS